MTPDEARQVLAQLDSRQLDTLPAAARDTLAAAAAAALTAETPSSTVEQGLGAESTTAKVIAVQRDRRGVRTVTVACPYCRPTRGGNPRKHTHGWGDGDAEPGSRVSHCLDGRRDYRIVLGEFAGVA
jgi:hypothetical protein